MIKYVFGDSYRIFVNTSMGCTGGCKYCYLPKLGINHNMFSISASEAIKLIEESDVRYGKNGSIISFGCYSECWDSNNRSKTIELIKQLALKNNYIQLATKKKISLRDLKLIDSCAQFKNQILIYLSAPTISHSRQIEPYTDEINLRLSPLMYLSNLDNIVIVLYIKPVIETITIQDLDFYRKIVASCNIPVVVGPMLDTRPALFHEPVLVGNNNLFNQESTDQEDIVMALKEHGNIFTHSTDIIDELRKNN